MISSEFVVSFLIAYAIVAYIPLWLGIFVIVSLFMYRVIKLVLWFLFAYPVQTWKTMVTVIVNTYFRRDAVDVIETEIKNDHEVEIKDE